MYQLISKRWGLTPDGKPVRLARYAADSASDELPVNCPIGSDCVTSDGKMRVFFGAQTGWITLKTGGGASGDLIDDTDVADDTCWSSAKVYYRLAEKADVTGEYPGLTAGTAQSLAGQSATERVYLFDSAGGSASIGSGTAKIKAIRGSTVRFRQRALPASAGTVTENGVTFVKDGNGKVTVSTTEEGASADTTLAIASSNVVAGHKYLRTGCPAGGSLSTYSFGSDVGSGFIWTASTTTGYNLVASVKSGTVLASPVTFYPQLFDLTGMFGAGNEPTAEEFRRMFPAPYYARTAGVTLLNFKGASLKATGFNAWDGAKARVIAGRDGDGANHGYELHGSYSAVEFSYTENGPRTTLTPASCTTEKGDTVTRILPPANGYVFITGAGADTCLNLIWSGNRSGANYAYEPYSESVVGFPTAACFPDGMRSAGEAYDEINAGAAVQRVGEIALSSLNWKMNGQSGNHFYCTSFTDVAYASANGAAGNVETEFAATVPHTDTYYKYAHGISVSASGVIWLYTPETYEDVAALKAAMGSNTFRYELKTPVVTTFESPLDLSLQVSDMGTEEVLSEAASAPARIVTAYAMNVQDTVARLDTDYISKASFDAFLDELNDKTGVGVTASKQGAGYVFTIDPGARILPAPTSADAGKIVAVNSAGDGYILKTEG